MLYFRVGRWGSNIFTPIWLDLDLTYDQAVDAVFDVIPNISFETSTCDGG